MCIGRDRPDKAGLRVGVQTVGPVHVERRVPATVSGETDKAAASHQKEIPGPSRQGVCHPLHHLRRTAAQPAQAAAVAKDESAGKWESL